MGSIWKTSGAVAHIGESTVQIWRLLLDQTSFDLVGAYAVLSKDEQERASRIRAGRPRDEFTAARAMLRLLLGPAVGAAPQDLQFALGEYGKPALAGGGVHFNVSHARGCVLVAMSRKDAVGVDVEPLDRIVEALELAQTHFHPEETAQIEREPEGQPRLAKFFQCWTRKEAVVKADGRGLHVPLARFCVLGDTEPVQVALPGGESLWVRDVPAGAGFAAALAVPNRDFAVDLYDFAGFA